MTTLLRFLPAGLVLGLLAGCGQMQLDTSSQAPASDTNRVVTGTVEVGETLPADASVLVRVVDQARHDFKNPNAVLGEPTATAAVSLPPEVVGEVRIPHAQGPSVPFVLKFYCTDEELSEGLVLEARVSYGGKVHFFNVQSYAVNSRNIGDSRQIYVNQVR